MDAGDRIIQEIQDQRKLPDTSMNETYIQGLRRALTLVVGDEHAHRMAVAAGEAE
jgi:hypothetical protein